MRPGHVAQQAKAALPLVVLIALAIDCPNSHAAHVVWVQAEDAARFHGSMSKGADLGLAASKAYGDFIAPATREEMVNESYAEYETELPTPGPWYFWGRFRYPTASDMSFSIVAVGERLLGDGSQWFGNSGGRGDVWHWDGRGGGLKAMPGRAAQVVNVLKAGALRFRVYARETAHDAALNPRLDVICITDDAKFRPSDSVVPRHVAKTLGAGLDLDAQGKDAIAIENERARLVMSRRGHMLSLQDRRGEEYALAGNRFLSAQVARAWHAVTRLSYDAPILSAAFGAGEATAQVRVSLRPRSMVFEVVKVTGEIEALRFVNIHTKPCVQAGGHGPIVFERFSIALVPLDLLTLCRTTAVTSAPSLNATCFKQFGLAPARAALVLCPVAEVPDAVDVLQRQYNLPLGMERRRLEDNRKSYLFIHGMSETNADELIESARMAGLGQILIGVSTWSRYGWLYEIRKSNFPHGEEGLKRVVDKVHAAGLKAGIHLFASKTPKTCAYTQGQADSGLLKDHFATLAQALDEKGDQIVTADPPQDFPVAEPYERDLQIDGEIVTYTDVSLTKPYGFVGCKRARYGTAPALHAAGASLGHLYIPPWGGGFGLFILDHESPLFAKVASRIADVYNRCGLDFIYFDGWMQKPYWRYVPFAQWEVYKRCQRAPVVWEEAVGSPFSAWHLVSRAGQRDYYGGLIPLKQLQKGVRGTVDGYRLEVDDSVTRRVPSSRRSLMPTEIGWYPFVAPTAKSRGTQMDDIEYLCSRALAYDTAFSITTRGSTIARHARARDLLQTIGNYERLRLSGYFDQPVRDRLKTHGQDFTLFRDAAGKWRILPAKKIERIGSDDDVRGMLFKLEGRVYVAFWHTWGETSMAVGLPPERCELLDREGKPMRLDTRDGRLTLAVGDRAYLVCRGLTEAKVVEALQAAKLLREAAVTLWLQAEKCKRLNGAMALGSSVGLRDAGAMGDFIVPTEAANRDRPADAYAEYTVEVPTKGLWHVWGRFRYPSGADDSFSLVPAGAPLVADASQWFGNSGARAKQWHWDGKGMGSAGMPGTASRDVTVTEAGPWTFRVYAREASGPVQLNPRLDAICITNSFRLIPSDTIAERELK